MHKIVALKHGFWADSSLVTWWFNLSGRKQGRGLPVSAKLPRILLPGNLAKDRNTLMCLRLDYFLLNSYLALIIPLAIYCLILFRLNRRTYPVMVSGAWDSIGLLFAASGVLLFSGPSLIAQRLAASMAEWIFVWTAYYLLILVGSVLLVWSRRDATVIYNVDADLLNEVLERVLDKVGLSHTGALVMRCRCAASAGGTR